VRLPLLFPGYRRAVGDGRNHHQRAHHLRRTGYRGCQSGEQRPRAYHSRRNRHTKQQQRRQHYPGLPLNVNLPAGVPTSGFLLWPPSPNFAVDFYITAAGSQGRGQIALQAKVITQNNEKATVKQGTKIPNSNDHQQHHFGCSNIDAVLKLEVTPQITPKARCSWTCWWKTRRSTIGIPRIEGIPGSRYAVRGDQGACGRRRHGGHRRHHRHTAADEHHSGAVLGSLPLIGTFSGKPASALRRRMLFFLTPRIIPG